MNVLFDSVELQKGEIVFDRERDGTRELRYTVEMYGMIKEYRFFVTDIPRNRSRVRIEASGVPKEKEESCIVRQFSVLESLMAEPYDTGT